MPLAKLARLAVALLGSYLRHRQHLKAMRRAAAADAKSGPPGRMQHGAPTVADHASPSAPRRRTPAARKPDPYDLN
jgi:hypothetical protein